MQSLALPLSNSEKIHDFRHPHFHGDDAQSWVCIFFNGACRCIVANQLTKMLHCRIQIIQPSKGYFRRMPSTTVRISLKAKENLQTLAAQSGQNMQAVLDEAIELYRRQHLLDQANTAFSALRADPQAWSGEVDERAVWDLTLSDDLER